MARLQVDQGGPQEHPLEQTTLTGANMADKKYDKDDLVILDELCEIGKLSKRSYRCLREQGRTPVAYRMGRRLYFKRGDVQAWMTTVRMVRIDPLRPPVWRR